MTETKTVIDLMEEYVRVAKMCDAYNEEHSTDINPWDCVRNPHLIFTDHPDLRFGHHEQTTFSIAILEGRPVFVGDAIYWVGGKEFDWKVDIMVGFSFKDHERITHIIKSLTWTPPTKKRTFMLNGVELPCPASDYREHKTLVGYRAFYWESEQHHKLFGDAIANLLTAAREKE